MRPSIAKEIENMELHERRITVYVSIFCPKWLCPSKSI